MRLDGRMNNKLRPVSIERGYIKYAEGSAYIKLGETQVICTVSVEEKIPAFLIGTGQGWITAEYGMLPRACEQRVPREVTRGKMGGRTHEIQRLIGRSLRAVVDLKQLGERTLWVDCDVIQADGGTRTAAITGAYVALVEALNLLKKDKLLKKVPLTQLISAVSVGLVEGHTLLDLTYAEDCRASVDMNIVMTGDNRFVEIQGTAEENPFAEKELEELLALAKIGIKDLIAVQMEVLSDIKELSDFLERK